MSSEWKRYLLPAAFSIATGLFGVAMQAKSDRDVEDMVRKAAREATRSEFDRIARQKHGDARHTG